MISWKPYLKDTIIKCIRMEINSDALGGQLGASTAKFDPTHPRVAPINSDASWGQPGASTALFWGGVTTGDGHGTTEQV